MRDDSEKEGRRCQRIGFGYNREADAVGSAANDVGVPGSLCAPRGRSAPLNGDGNGMLKLDCFGYGTDRGRNGRECPDREHCSVLEFKPRRECGAA